jgi:Icc-related predicted phosphoesterase
MIVVKLHVVSDLHLEVWPEPVLQLPVLGDVLILAGDIVRLAYIDRLRYVAFNYIANHLPVLFVPGNHEFWYAQRDVALSAYKWYCRQNGIEFLHNRAVVIGGVQFCGTTLWTNYQLMPLSLEKAMILAATLFEHGCIRKYGDKIWMPADARKAHTHAMQFLHRAVPQHQGTNVVITHHAPSRQSVHSRYKYDNLNVAFASHLPKTFEKLKPALWIHGHMHNGFDYYEDSTRVICNPRGYPYYIEQFGDQLFAENPEFNPDLVITV